ncbi:MAG TPA: Spy/CpxP family protein refolding chaperone, partial [Pyrinomonadaceae bacterium]|nr:Spy/CpxP family protein refolding chaperone [Pyrinomonadaceae bacterium]
MSRSPAQLPALLAALALSALLLLPAHARAQVPPQEDAPAPDSPAPRRRRDAAGLLARLNLTPEQRAQIRDIRRQTELQGRPLLQRLRQARRTLDAAIYSDTADDASVQERLREFTHAQSEVARLRALTELRVRRVLTPEQLGVLRDMRRRARLAQRERSTRRLGARRANGPDDAPSPQSPEASPYD